VAEQQAETVEAGCSLCGDRRLQGSLGGRARQKITHLWPPSTGLEGLRAPSEPLEEECIFNRVLAAVVPFRALTLGVVIGGQSRRAPPTQRGWRSTGGPVQEKRRD
jgi:hypothetical protein